MGWLGFVPSANNFSLFKRWVLPQSICRLKKKKGGKKKTKPSSRGNETVLKPKAEEMG